MVYVSCTLRQLTPVYDSIGVKTSDTVVETEVPIIAREKVKVTEFYRASELGMKPELRLRLSALNYDGQQEVEYGGVIYNIIRVEAGIDVVTIIGERKLKNA